MPSSRSCSGAMHRKPTPLCGLLTALHRPLLAQLTTLDFALEEMVHLRVLASGAAAIAKNRLHAFCPFCYCTVYRSPDRGLWAWARWRSALHLINSTLTELDT